MWETINNTWKLLSSYFNVKYFGNTLGEYTLAFIIIFIAFVIRFVICSIVYRHLEAWVAKRRKENEKTLKKIKRPLAYAILLAGLMVASQVLSWGGNVNVTKFLVSFFSTLLSLCVTWMGVRFVDILSIYLRIRAEKTEGKFDDQLVPLISKSLKIFIFVVGFASIIKNLGYSISGILAGLGIGGIAIAMAAKDSLSNIFGSITIFLDNPFQVGDWIKAGDVEGTVESIGFRSTKLRTFYKTQISIPNNKIANITIDNFSRMHMRRISMTIGFTYETTADEMEKAIAKIKEVLKTHPGVYKDFFLVNFTEFGPSSLDVMLYYFANTVVWADYLQIRQEVNLAIMRVLKEVGVEFAFKSMSIYLRGSEKDSIPQIKMI